MAEIDNVFREFAAAFAGAFKDTNLICFPEKLDRSELDLSHDSLKIVDNYLLYLHRHKEQLDVTEWDSTVLYGGAYVGEVIREATKNYFYWIDYDDYMLDHPDLQVTIPERTTATCAFLVDDSGGISMPLNKIARFIEDGEENSVHFNAHCDNQHARDA